MNAQQVFAVILCVLIIGMLTGAALGRVSWMSFWIVAAIAGLYILYQKKA